MLKRTPPQLSTDMLNMLLPTRCIGPEERACMVVTRGQIGTAISVKEDSLLEASVAASVSGRKLRNLLCDPEFRSRHHNSCVTIIDGRLSERDQGSASDVRAAYPDAEVLIAEVDGFVPHIFIRFFQSKKGRNKKKM